jgi:LCP family protein required for cell wall assembly
VRRAEPPNFPENSLSKYERRASHAGGARHAPEAASDSTRRPATREERERSHVRRRRVVVVLAIAAAMLLAAAGWAVYGYFGLAHTLQAPDPQTVREVRAVLDTPAPPPSAQATSAPEYILLLGEDARPGEKRARSDTIIIARVDVMTTKTVALLSLPRDSRVPIDGHGLDKITHANAFGGPALAIKTVKDYTGLPINHYVKIRFLGLSKVVDSMGGIVMNVDGAVPGTLIQKGVQRLNGTKALAFVRNRALAGGDFARIRHQQQFLKAMAKQALQSSNVTRLPAIINSAAGNVETDMSIPQIVALANGLRGTNTDAIPTYMIPGTGTRIGGIYYFIPDEARAASLIAVFKIGQVPAQ